MADQPHIVIRLVPQSPVDGATFGTYLDGLALQVFDAYTQAPRSDIAYASPLILSQPPGATGNIAAVSVPTAEPTSYDKGNDNYGSTLKFNSTDGISVGMFVFSADKTTIAPNSNMYVTDVTEATSTAPGIVNVKGKFAQYVAAGTVVSFLGQLPSGSQLSNTGYSFPLSTSGPATSIGDELLVLHFADASGVTVGMGVSEPSVAPGITPSVAPGTSVAEVSPARNPTDVVVSQALSGTPASVIFTLNPPFASFDLTPKSATLTTLTFDTDGTKGIATGMTLSPDPDPVNGRIAPGTRVTKVDSTTVTLSKPLRTNLPAGQPVTFTFPLSSGIFQHLEPAFVFDFFGIHVALVPASVATVVIPLNPAPPLPNYLDIKIRATRGSEVIPLNNTYHNVKVSTDKIPDTPDQYQAIAASNTSLYLALPPQPGTNPISLEIPDDGSAPPFDLLHTAIETALANDPLTGATIFTLVGSPAECTRIAYDIIWSYQNTLPAPPDPLESLYTNPPNPGGGGTVSTKDNTSNNYEQDRQKFEGNLSSFYSTRNANAERLTKFVAAVSAAVACEEMSVRSTAALLGFPVDPASSFSAAVQSQLLVTGLGSAGTSGLDFGVPAAFFYALGAHLDKTTTPAQRFQMATGEAIERLLQQFSTAENALVIKDSEAFTEKSLGLPDITSFQAARRLVALGVSAASNSPSVTVFAGWPLASLIGQWLSAEDPLPQNPPLTYQNTDFNIWAQQLATAEPDGYVDLDLNALTQGYIITPFAASTIAGTASGSVLTFGAGTGIGAGMPVSGPNVAPGTTVKYVTATVTLSANVLADVPAGSIITFAPVVAPTTADCTPGSNVLTFAPGAANGITAGMPVSGPNLVAGTTVQRATATTVTLSTDVLADVPAGSIITFAPVTAGTTADCPSGGNVLTFGPGAANGISAGMHLSGPGIGAGTTVQGVPPTAVTLSKQVLGNVPAGAVLVFNFATPPVTLTTTADCPSGTALLTFGGADGASWIRVGMSAAGPDIAAGTTVQSVTATTVTLSANVSADLPSNSVVTFFIIPATPIAPVTATTTAESLPGVTLTFSGPAGTNNISSGMPVAGPNIAPGTRVQKLTSTTVTLSMGVLATVPGGSVIMFDPVTATTTADCGQNTSVLTFGSGKTEGITAGMSVSGAGIAAGTTVQSVTATTVTLGAAVPADVPSGSDITFAPLTATTTADCLPGTMLTFGPGGTNGIGRGMPVSGANIAAGTTVQSVTATTVTLGRGILATVPSGSVITFAPLTATTTADCPQGTTVLTFSTTTGVNPGMSVLGANIAAGTTVQSVTATTVILSTGVRADVHSGSVVTFVVIPSTLADQIAAWLPSTTSPPTPAPTVATLKQVTAAQWTAFFTVTGSPQWLPPFTAAATPGAPAGQGAQKAGNVAVRIRAFIRAVQQFFTVSSVATHAKLPPADAPPTFDLPVFDPIGQAAGVLPAGFKFGNAVSGTDLTNAAQTVFTSDLTAQAWLDEAMTAVNDLAAVASAATAPTISGGYTPPASVSFSFSVMEALYARGFRSAADITSLSGADFQQALTGTIAYDSASALYGKAKDLAPPSPASGQAGGAFEPVNPDGTLVNCVPPPSLSPTGPIAYLHEMLTVSGLSTCEAVTAPPLSLVTAADAAAGDTTLAFASAADESAGMSATAEGIADGTTVTAADATTVTLSQALTAAIASGTIIVFTAPTLGTALAERRGPVGELAASPANLETSLPLIDLVNECLEYLASAETPTGGTVYDTAPAPATGPGEDEGGPGRLLAAEPAYSTPATPSAANAAVEPAVFDKLKADFSSCELPYSQALDVSQTYLRHLGGGRSGGRFEAMRTFRKCITEFALDPANEPAGFQSWLWRYPVRIDTAIEYLGISPEEYTTLFQGTAAPPCAPAEAPAGIDAAPWAAAAQEPGDEEGTVWLPAFLAETCLSYCEFYELWESGFVPFRNGASPKQGEFPRCEPCCPDDIWLRFPGDQPEQDLTTLLVFVRLWRKLRQSCDGYTFAQLRDICDVLQLRAGGVANPDFIRQLAAFQMLRDDFGMDLTDPAAPVQPGAVDADRTHLLALWAGPGTAHWQWAVQQLIRRIEQHAQQRHGCERRSAHLVRLLTENLDPLSRLAGFDPETDTDTWHTVPTHTLRFAEVLAKIYASRFSVGELVFLFTGDAHLDGDDPFPLEDENEALDSPLGLPDDEPEFALWRLRREMLEARVADGEDEEWPWRHVEAALHSEFGFAPDDVAALGQHFFPGMLARSGHHASPQAARFTCDLAPDETSASMWNNPPDGPLEYDSEAGQLCACVPLTDRALIRKLTQVYDLNQAEQGAVQDLFFQPRAMLAGFALLFEDFEVAQRKLIEEADEAERFRYFRHQFLLCRHRCHLIARHLARHVAAATGQDAPDDGAAAALILRTLAADENKAATSWEDDSGAPPALTWTAPAGSALAALLGLAGTGLVAEYRPEGGAIAWRDTSGPLAGFGAERDRDNCPVPTVLPSLSAALTPEQMRSVSVHNGFLMDDASGSWLGGAQGFSVTWSGALLIEHDGTYEFWAGAPTLGEDSPDFEAAEHRRWRVVLRRGQRSWVILSHHWDSEEEHRSSSLPLRRGAYQLTAELIQPAPEFDRDEPVRRQHTGFQVKYSGPDSGARRVEIPHSRLFVLQKDRTLAADIAGLSPGAAAYLDRTYVSSLRDIRRTYQRAFKSLLFAHRFAVSAQRQPHGTSELGYMLEQAAQFAGVSFYRAGDGFTRHSAQFALDFLPVRDDYHSPGQDARTAPSPQRTQAMFDWWERAFDYTAARAEVHRRCGRQLWHLFEEAQEKQPADPAYLLRHVGADARHWRLDLRYFQGQQTPVYAVTSTDLEDDRWVVRAWHADRWLRELQSSFAAGDIAAARPDLWASDDPSAELPAETETGNANLVAFANHGYLDNGEPRRYHDLKRLNDGLRDRGRHALIAYLCHMDRVALPWQPGQFATGPGDLSDLLLLDVEAGLCQRASRIEEAITAVQSFVRRSRLGLEPGWTVTSEFARLWESRFENYRTWERCRRRELYRESWIEWDELREARRIEAFRFLESQLRSSALSLAAPGGLDWWADDDADLEQAPELLQRRVPAELRPLSPLPKSASREGLATLGSPEYAAQPTWLAAVPQVSSATVTPPPAQDGPDAPPGPAIEAGGAADPAPPGPAPALARAAAGGMPAPTLPLWMESAIKLGTRFVRVAAADTPDAAGGFVPHGNTGREACCSECGRDHPVLVDEYYFWLVNTQVYSYTAETDAQSDGDASFTGSYQFGFQDSYYDQYQQQSAEWDEEDQVPPLLAKWQPDPAVRLAWCRVHNGQFGQPRRSEEYVEVNAPPDLVFLGRAGDSLYFQVAGSAPLPAGYGADKSPPGFRYDLPPDHAVALPRALKPPAPQSPSPYPGGLLSYPYFAYHEPGARLFPGAWFPASLLVADALRVRCRYELALRWYRRSFDPLGQDCAWVHCPDMSQEPSAPDEIERQEAAADERGTPQQGACCDSTDVTEQGARNRAVTLHYCRTLLDWGDALMRRRRSPEAFQQARVLYDLAAKITGQRPRTVLLPEPSRWPTVATFVPAYAPLNPQLLDLYDLVADRLGLIRRCLNAGRLRNGRPGRDMRYFGDSQLADLPGAVSGMCADDDWCGRPSPYRFLSQIQKAIELAGRVRELGAALLSAYEKGDAEYLAAIRAEQEREMLALGIAIRQDQWRDADWQVQALHQTKEVNQANLLYYAGMYQVGLINDEIQNLSLTTNALQTRTTANVTEVIGEVMSIIPDFFVGAMSTFSQVPIGTKLAGLFQTIAKVMQAIADIQSTTAGMDMTQAGWQRRSTEWFHQTQTLPIEIQQIELQTLGAHRRRDQALRELNNQQRQIEHAAEVQDFLRDKFTATDLYLWLQKETTALHAGMYELAHHAAREAQRAFHFERGHTTRRFIPEETWDDLHQGLMAGERLEFALRHMEKAYLDENRREHELTRHFSLRLDFPAAYLRLRITGGCEISIPEWMFDLDYPGYYMRRIKNVTLTLPCVTGPYTGVHCRLTLLSSMTRIHPETRPPAHGCCGDGTSRSEYEPCHDDPRVVREYAARESIATSSGQNDSGLFELNFRDERRLPFEFLGAVSRWRIELPQENNYFDLDTLTDAVLHLNYTAREGGAALREAAARDARGRLPGDGLRLFDVRHDFPDAWPALRRPDPEHQPTDRDRRHRSLRLGFTRAMFPFVPGRRVQGIDQLLLMFAAPDAVPGRQHIVRFRSQDADRDDVREFACVADGAWPGFFCGAISLREHPLGPLQDGHPVTCTFEIPAQVGRIHNAFVIASYDAAPGHPEG